MACLARRSERCRRTGSWMPQSVVTVDGFALAGRFGPRLVYTRYGRLYTTGLFLRSLHVLAGLALRFRAVSTPPAAVAVNATARTQVRQARTSNRRLARELVITAPLQK